MKTKRTNFNTFTCKRSFEKRKTTYPSNPDKMAKEEQYWQRGLSLLQVLHYRTHSLQHLVFEQLSESLDNGS